MIHHELAPEFDQCIKCGLCMAACPVHKELLLEKYSPRGKVQLARYFTRENAPFTDHTREVFADCLLCGACSVTCPSGVDLNRIFLAMREAIASKRGLAPGIGMMVQSLIQNRNIAKEDNEDRCEWMDDLPEDAIRSCIGARADIVYFVGCVASFFPMVQGIPRNMTKILEASGASFAVLAGKEWCCGFPMIASGALEHLDELIAHNLDRIKSLGASTVVFSCPSCLKTWREHYSTDLELLHSTQLIDRFIEEGRLSLGPVEGTLTYHDPCDLGRQGGEYEAPRKIIGAIPGVSFVELNGIRAQSVCCGGGGNVEAANPELSGLVAQKKLAQVKESGADVLVTACQQCVRTIKGAARKMNESVQVWDITDLIVRAMSVERPR